MESQENRFAKKLAAKLWKALFPELCLEIYIYILKKTQITPLIR